MPLAWLVLGLIHATPAAAVVRPRMLTRLYAVELDSPLFLLLQHRAVFFATIVLVCAWAALDPGARRVASVVVGASVVSFLVFYWRSGSPRALRWIAVTDRNGIPFLAVATVDAWR